jgi:hypothetical protein
MKYRKWAHITTNRESMHVNSKIKSEKVAKSNLQIDRKLYVACCGFHIEYHIENGNIHHIVFTYNIESYG